VALAELQFRHLRHTAVTRLAEAGVSDSRIASVTGHSPRSIVSIIDRYRVRTRIQSRQALRQRTTFEKSGNGAD